MGMLVSLLKLKGLSWPIPDYSTACLRLIAGVGCVQSDVTDLA